MKKIIILSLVSLVLVSCGDKREFRSYDAKFEYCSDYIDSSDCGDIRPLVLLYLDTYMKTHGVRRSVCSFEVYSDTDTCKNYYYTNKYKTDLDLLARKCRDHPNISYCTTFGEISSQIDWYRSL